LFSNFHQREFTGQAGTAWELAKHLSKRFDVGLISNSEFPEPAEESSVHLWVFPCQGNPTAKYLLRFPLILSHVLSWKPHRIHVHGLPFIVFAKVLGFLTRTPVTCSFNEDISLRPVLVQRAIAWCINRTAMTFDRVLAFF
jgi:hypothetical protein